MSLRSDKAREKPHRHVNYVGLADAATASLDAPEPMTWKSKLEEYQATACKHWNKQPKGDQ